MHKSRVTSFTYQKFSIGTDSQSHHMTSVTHHALHPLPVAREHNLLLPSHYIPCGAGGGGVHANNSQYA